jgi:hypothetical protein
MKTRELTLERLSKSAKGEEESEGHRVGVGRARVDFSGLRELRWQKD